MSRWSSSAVRWLRVVHRDLGYVMVGVCLIYGTSGMLLNHMGESDPAYKSTHAVASLPAGLSVDELAAAWSASDAGRPRLKSAAPIDDTHTRLLLDGGIGVYDALSGTADYELHRKRVLIYWINRLHYNKVGGWSVMADFFAVSLIFFALSGLFMVRGKKGLRGRGKWFLAVGLLIPVMYILLQ